MSAPPPGPSIGNQLGTAFGQFMQGSKKTFAGINKTASSQYPLYRNIKSTTAAVGKAAYLTAGQGATALKRQSNAYLASPAGAQAKIAAAQTASVARGLTSAARNQLTAASQYVKRSLPAPSSNDNRLQQSMGETCRLCRQVCKMNGGATRRKRKNKRKTRNSKKY
jgi:hypothetical protein